MLPVSWDKTVKKVKFKDHMITTIVNVMFCHSCFITYVAIKRKTLVNLQIDGQTLRLSSSNLQSTVYG